MFAAKPEHSTLIKSVYEDQEAGWFRHAGDAMLLLDTAGHSVVDANTAALRLFGTSHDRITGSSFQSLCPTQQPDAGDSAIAASQYTSRAECGETLRYQWRFLRSEGGAFDADVTFNRLPDSGRHLVAIRELSQIPAIAGIEQTLRERTVQLDSINGELDAISYAVSHDLRAAILGIAACSQIMVDDFGASLSEDARRWLDHIHEDSVQLDKLTQALLELSRASRRTLKPEEIDLTAMARRISDELVAQNRAGNLEFRVAEGLRSQGDPVLIQTLLRNLLDNAWKFTATITNGKVEFGCLPCDPPGRSTVFYVRDNGVGFDMANADRLFIPYQRLHRDPRYGGNGIGLATVRRIAHRHGGKTWAEGAPDAGATFFFTLGGQLA